MATLAPCVAAPGLAAQQHGFGHPWTTRPEFEIGEGAAGSGPAAFGLISAVRVLGNGDRILVVEAASARATIWTPEGSLIGEVGGPGEGPGEFAGMFGVQVLRSGPAARASREGKMKPAGTSGRMRCRQAFPSVKGMLVAVQAFATAEIQAVRPQQTWTTRPEYRIDEPGGSDAGFGRFSRLRVGGDGDHIVIRDPGAPGAIPPWRVLICRPEGKCMPGIGPDDVPAELGPPTEIRAGATGFRLRFDGRLLRFLYDSRTPVDDVTAPAGMEHFTPLDDGGLLGLGRLPAWNFEGDNEPPGERVVFTVADTGGEWKRDTIAVLDIRHMGWFVAVRGESSRYNSQVLLQQPFADHDLTWIDAQAGTIGIARRNGGKGIAEVFEISATGDTIWHRRLSLPAVPLPQQSAEQAIEAGVALLGPDGERHGLTMAQLRTIVVEALHVPSHLPAVSGVVATASGEVWLKTPGVADGLVSWYSIPRGESQVSPRLVLLPATLRLQDALGDHVWGFSRESSRPRHVLGLRLVPLSR